MDLLAKIKLREPEYDANYYELILDYTIEQGSSMGTASEEEKWKQGKYFSTRYEMYMYAVILGMKRDYSVPLEKGIEKKSFIKIDSWRPAELADYIIMCAFSKLNTDFFKLENLEEVEIDKKVSELKTIIEGYANGGLDIIRSKKEEDGSYFLENNNAFLDLLED